MIDKDSSPTGESVEHNQREIVDLKCPHLGLRTDPATYFNYPSTWNCCHYCRPVTTPLLPHQQSNCLTRSYPSCVVFESQSGVKMPADLVEVIGQPSKNIKLVIILALLLLFILIGFLLLTSESLFIGKTLQVGDTQKALTQHLVMAESPTVTLTEIGEQISVTTEEIKETINVEVELPTDLPTVEVILKLDTPIGTDQEFIIHQIADGESLEQYAVMYNTSRETIVKINYLLPIPLWIDWLVVIPLDLIDAVDLPTFEAYLVTDEEISLEKLALKLGSDVEKMAYFNGIESSHVFYRGDYILVPREGYYFTNP